MKVSRFQGFIRRPSAFLRLPCRVMAKQWLGVVSFEFGLESLLRALSTLRFYIDLLHPLACVTITHLHSCLYIRRSSAVHEKEEDSPSTASVSVSKGYCLLW